MTEPDKSNNLSWEQKLLTDYFQTIHKEQVRDRRWSLALRTLRTVGVVLMMLVAYALVQRPTLMPWESSNTKGPHTAQIFLKGTITADSVASADNLIPAIKAAFENEQSRAVIIRVNSPGGSAVQAGLMYDEIKAQRIIHPGKPVYAVIEDIGASGGYYVAMAADKIFANRASLVGSIGVISSSFGFTGLMDKLGIERRSITAGANKDLLDPFSPLTNDTKAFWESVLAQTHKQFTDRVIESRGDRLPKDDSRLFSGLIWNGEQAMNLGLIDGLESVESVAREIVGESTIVNYTPREDMFSKLASKATIKAAEALNTFSSFNFSF